jgi:di/tricarboxylate transporter
MPEVNAVIPSSPLAGQLRRAWRALRADPLLSTLVLVLLALTLAAPQHLASYPSRVEWPTIAALAGLLALTKGLEASGALHRLGAWLVHFMATERRMALCLVVAAAALSTVLTNDVALFAVVPLTLSLGRLTGLPVGRFIIFEALAVNAGSALTPIGNPQNLFLWQGAGVSFGAFVLHMLPLVAVLMGLLLGLTALCFRGQAIRPAAEAAVPLDRPLLALSLLLYGPFLVATDMQHAVAAAGVLGAVFLAFRPRLLRQLDWGLLAVFVLMFLDLRLLAALPAVRQAVAGWGLDDPQQLYAVGILASQLVSNVPAAIALAEYSRNWQVLAYAVNVGGFGFMLGSLANLIALRMAADRRTWWGFHLYAVPFLGAAAAVGWALLFSRG